MNTESARPAAPVEMLVSHLRSQSQLIGTMSGGRNSAALRAWCKQHGISVAYWAFADTGGEREYTYDFVNAFDELVRREDGTEVVWSKERQTLEDDCLSRHALPGKAYGFGSCSEHFKLRPMRRTAKERFPTGDVTWLVGIHAGEKHRIKEQFRRDGRHVSVYPLVESGWSEQDCEQAVLDMGLAVPPKSACFFCPAMRKSEVVQLSKDAPELFERAVQIENNAAETNATIKGLGRRWTWKALVAADRRQRKLFDDEQAPACEVCFDGELWELLQQDNELPEAHHVGQIRGQWIPVSERLPTHIYTVAILVVDGPLHHGDDYLDVGIYNAERQRWQANNGPDDIEVNVSHWMHLDRPGE